VRGLGNLALFEIGSLTVLIGLVWIFRAQLLPLAGVNFDAGVGGEARLTVPGGYVATVFASGLNGPRFMAVSPDGLVFVAELWWLPWDGAPAGDPEPFATGFLPDGTHDALGRPAGLAVGADGALYVSDDKAGFIYRIAPSG
jgi:glucose/arabinose dehydrogenase